jgi:hypothetical protein
VAGTLGQDRNIPKFTAERSLRTTAAHYRSASGTHGCSAEQSVSPQLRRSPGGGLGNTSSCDGCDTFSYVGCLMDCGAPQTDCTRACLAKKFDCDLCSVDGLFHFGGRLVM